MKGSNHEINSYATQISGLERSKEKLVHVCEVLNLIALIPQDERKRGQVRYCNKRSYHVISFF